MNKFKIQVYFFTALISANIIFATCIAYGDDDVSQKAAKAYKEGTRLFEEGAYSEAAVQFRLANSLKGNWKILYNLAQSEAAAGHYGIALETFEESITRAADEMTQKRSDEVLAEIRRLRDLVGSIDIEAPIGSVVFIDDIKRGTLPLDGSILISAGVRHHIKITLNDQTILEKQLKVNGHESRTVKATTAKEDSLAANSDIEQEQAETPATTIDSSNTTPKNKLKISAWTILGTGVAAIIGGSIAGGINLSKNKTLKDDYDCVDNHCPSSAKDTLDAGKKAGIASTILFAAGGALTATGIIMLIINKKRDSSDKLSLVPTINNNFTGLTIMRSF
ncbi:MAG: hypothetical protein JXR91_12030 [Deltaproteobacteria bacterium]|nr:hypothetical protein [Deltaproteobacteria bacterium]